MNKQRFEILDRAQPAVFGAPLSDGAIRQPDKIRDFPVVVETEDADLAQRHRLPAAEGVRFARDRGKFGFFRMTRGGPLVMEKPDAREDLQRD